MRYITIETQTASDGSAQIIPNLFDDKLEAESEYHKVLQYASISEVPRHGCTLLTTDGEMLKSEWYEHEEVADAEQG